MWAELGNKRNAASHGAAFASPSLVPYFWKMAWDALGYLKLLLMLVSGRP